MLTIVLPIAGRGSRFADVGYRDPKPMIPVFGQPMIALVAENVRPRRPHRFVFVARQEHLDGTPMRAVLEAAAPGCLIVPVDRVTEGAACTVLLAREAIPDDGPLLLANSDQYVDAPIDDFLAAADATDGCLMTFPADDPKWSFVRRDADGRVAEVVEKRVVSSEATVGLYHFARGGDFVRAADAMIAAGERVNGEYYVAPTYNRLIAEGARIGTFAVGPLGRGMHGLGVPADLDAFVALPLARRAAARAAARIAERLAAVAA